MKDKVVAQALTSDLNDPDGFADEQKDRRYRELAAAFNSGADGEKSAPRLAQSQLLITQTAKDYVIAKTRYDHADEHRYHQQRRAAYSEQMQNIQTSKEFLEDRRLVDFVLVAHLNRPKGVTDDFMKQVFSSDLDDSKSFANQQNDHRFSEIAASFNFDKDGNICRRSLAFRGGMAAASPTISIFTTLEQLVKARQARAFPAQAHGTRHQHRLRHSRRYGAARGLPHRLRYPLGNVVHGY